MTDYLSAREHYWLDSVDVALDIAEAQSTPWVDLTDEQRHRVARSLAESTEHEGVSTGESFLADPRDDEHKRVVARMQAQIDQLEADVQAFRQSVATRRGTSVSEVYLERETGTVLYR